LLSRKKKKKHFLKTPQFGHDSGKTHPLDQPSFLKPAIFTKPSRENCWSKNFLRAYGHLAGQEGTPKRYLIGVRAWPIDQLMFSLRLKMIQDWINSQDHLFIEMTNPTELPQKKNMTPGDSQNATPEYKKKPKSPSSGRAPACGAEAFLI